MSEIQPFPRDGVCPSASAWRAMLAEDSRPIPPAAEAHLEGCPHCQAVVEEISGGGHTWLAIADDLRRHAPLLPTVCREVLADCVKPTTPTSNEAPMPPCIHVERMMHRQSMAVLGDSAACYTLVKLIPGGLGNGVRALRLNLALG